MPKKTNKKEKSKPKVKAESKPETPIIKKKELIDQVYDEMKWPTIEDVYDFIKAYHKVMMNNLANGNEVKTELGSFSMVTRKRDRYYDINKKEWIEKVHIKQAIKFKPSAKLNREVNQ